MTEVQEKISKIALNKNILILSPTGSGKTEAMHSWILCQSKKAIMIQPMKTLATSIYNRLNSYHDKLNLPKWTIQHSSYQEDKWLSNKYCVTTIDQVLAGYLGLGTQSFIKGKNVLLSNLVFDEVQLFEPNKTLLTTINMLKQINDIGNRFIIMTATMPKYLINYLKKIFDMEVVICEEESVKDRKIKINIIEKIDYAKINTTKEKQIIVCNTQKEQLEVYENIQDKERCIVLNSKLLPTDRRLIEEKVVKYFGKESEQNDKILIATQVIEAGIDISADIMYSFNCPIDSLIQRAGRCSRWGGNGELIVVVNKNIIYDSGLVKHTNSIILENKDNYFTWENQKKWIDEILNPYYEKYINDKNIIKNKSQLKLGSQKELIRNIENVNIIISNNPKIEDFNKENVSIHIGGLKKISELNDIYIKNGKDIKNLDNINSLQTGDTVVITGNDCVYDVCGFRYSNGDKCEDFTYINNHTSNIKFEDYINEPWIDHSILTREVVKESILKDNFNNEVVKSINEISNILGLHDIGKLDELWQGDKWANSKNTPLAHFPFKKGVDSRIFKDRNHAIISAEILKPYCNKIIYNVILQHHGRKKLENSYLKISKYQLHNKHSELLSTYGFNEEVKESGSTIRIDSKSIINPNNKRWGEFLYLIGTLMESEIKAINQFREKYMKIA